MPAPAVTGDAISLCCAEGKRLFGQPVCSIAPSIPGDGHHVRVALTKITAEIGIVPAVPRADREAEVIAAIRENARNGRPVLRNEAEVRRARTSAAVARLRRMPAPSRF
jgi:hypothetical protein